MMYANRPSNTVRNRSAGPKGVPADRRRRRHLRELCDEVLASYRVAANLDVISDADRAAAQTLLSQIAPLGVK
jgi:hypothetical protein